MPTQFLNIKDVLNRTSRFQYRHTIILSGDDEWQTSCINNIVKGHEKKCLWVGDDGKENVQSVVTKKAHNWLGREKHVVIFNANTYFDADAFAAISGIIVGGGVFILLMPKKSSWHDIYTSNFNKRVITSISSNDNITLITPDTSEVSLRLHQEEPHTDTPKPFLSFDQQKTVETIIHTVNKEDNLPIVINSDRGRGKSASLGIVAAKLLLSGMKNIIITAPRLRATDVVFKHIAEQLPEAEILKGCVKYNECEIKFYSPDNIIIEKLNAELLLVDEAAAIPVPILKTLLGSFPQCVFSTTVHGYEGTGRGFSLRFFKELDKHNSAWIKLHMQTPVRWPNNDPLEKWVFDLLCLDAEIIEDEFPLLSVNDLNYRLIDKNELLHNEVLLREIFSLLVIAHYRTRPRDLKSLLDDENVSIYAALHNDNIVAISLVNQEGLFSEELSSDVYYGKRRPSGHLLAQSLTYHCGVKMAATLDYSRIMRVAVNPNFQNKNIGTFLLRFIISNEEKKGRDAIGTSYGMNNELLSFWRKSKFELIRIGFTREQISGEHAAIMLHGLSDKGMEIQRESAYHFKSQLPYWLNDVLKDIPAELQDGLLIDKIKPSSDTSKMDDKDLQSFIQGARNYELCIGALNKLVINQKDKIDEKSFPTNYKKIIYSKVMHQKDWKDIAKEMALNGKNEARKLFSDAIIFLITP